MNDKKNNTPNNISNIKSLIGTPDDLDYNIKRYEESIKGDINKELKTTNEILKYYLSNIDKLLSTISGITERQYTKETRGTEGLFYRSPLTAIQVATPNPGVGQEIDPEQISFDTLTQVLTGTVGYQRERVWDSVHTKAPTMFLVNDGTVPLYVRESPNRTKWSREIIVLAGECTVFYNCWELRIRATVAGNVSDVDNITGGAYRLGEYQICHLPYVKTSNRTSFTSRNVAVPAVAPGINLPNISIPSGFSVLIRANVNNVGNIYLAGPIPAGAVPNPAVDAVNNVAIAANRITLAPGDAARLFITNTNFAAVLGTGAGQTVDILVEQ